MRFATFKGEQSLSELVDRLFQFKAPSAKALAKEGETPLLALVAKAEAALLKANPHLSDLEKVPEGTLIMVPESADIDPTEEARPVGLAAGELVEEVHRALADLRSRLDASVARYTEEAKDDLKLLESREIEALAVKVPTVKERLPKIAEAAEARLQEAEALKISQEQALEQLDKDLSELVKHLGNGPLA